MPEALCFLRTSAACIVTKSVNRNSIGAEKLSIGELHRGLITTLHIIILFFMPTMWHNDGLKSPDNIPVQNGNVYNSDFESHHNDHDGGHH